MANQIKSSISFNKNARAVGEPFVWFSGMGLALGVGMILFLLGLIFIKGTDVFWPKSVALIEFKDTAASYGGKKIAGIITKTQQKIGRVILETQASQDSTDHMEWQLFIGNKDVYGYNFKFFDVDDMAKVTYPKDIVNIERLEYGNAIAFPVMLKFDNGETITSDQSFFRKRLNETVRTVEQRWKEIKVIEKKQIGAINLKLSHLSLKAKALANQSGVNEKALSVIQDQKRVLEEQYQTLAANARALRELQKKGHFIYKLASGETHEIVIGNLIGFHYPNQMSWFQKFGLFCQHIWEFLSQDPREANTEGGVFPAIFGTFVMTVLMSLAVTPFGVLAAIYLREYAKQGLLVRSVRIAVNNLAGVPSIVFGVFGLGFFVYFVGGTIDRLFFKEALPTPTFGTGGILWAALTLALLTVPVVIVATEEAIASVPRGMREGSFACGASKWQTIQHIVLPAAAPGILTGLILAMARGASEVAPLMLVGVVKLAPNLPLDGIFPFFHLERKFMHLGFHIYDLGFQSPDSEAAKPMVFATTLLLIALVVLLNLGAIFIRERIRKKYATGAF
ncbi:MAG: phosphate ABC transporter, permease protein PstA [Candidatus Omnitrophica bacterium CG11_big_fil_rev_8_21_14_0_20_45_26]|uniref:Phosphate transport system permease protein PstA n=1 Tax=Candidatus Abzuiibacterium crystallinum TaxID=1974748 RepID=A0A2H0LSQ1_9BACT|nr:MAG: phosphate ABC transporter, permease protein PstA [Candidatus Omnitrophica bacterium CG11_big_fil_rev_8_21_14_0_20_45_26]